MTHVVVPRCKLCGSSHPYQCPLCDEWYCRDCMGPRGECTHVKYNPVQQNPDWDVPYDEGAPIDAEDLRGKIISYDIAADEEYSVRALIVEGKIVEYGVYKL